MNDVQIRRQERRIKNLFLQHGIRCYSATSGKEVDFCVIREELVFNTTKIPIYSFTTKEYIGIYSYKVKGGWTLGHKENYLYLLVPHNKKDSIIRKFNVVKTDLRSEKEVTFLTVGKGELSSLCKEEEIPEKDLRNLIQIRLFETTATIVDRIVPTFFVGYFSGCLLISEDIFPANLLIAGVGIMASLFYLSKEERYLLSE